MYALNIDPLNPKGNPSAAELAELGVQMVRYTFKDYTAGDQPDPHQVRFYSQKIREYDQAGIDSLLILSYETYPNSPWTFAPDQEWDTYLNHFVRRVGQLAEILAPWRPALQIWNEPDLPPQFGTTLREAVYGRMLRRAYEAIKAVDPTLPVVGAGLTARTPEWLEAVIQAENGHLALDVLALHPYEQRPEPDWPRPDWKYGYVGDLIELYQQAGDWPIWFTEIGTNLPDDVEAEYLRRFYQTIIDAYAASVEEIFWFCYSDGMVVPFGLLDSAGQPKPAYHTYRQLASQVVTLDRLHYFAQYVEQTMAFRPAVPAVQAQMKAELQGVTLNLSRMRLRRVIAPLLAGSDFAVRPEEIDSLYALQEQKDLHDTLRATVLATHQRTGALTGRIGAHTRIAAESEANAATNIEAVMQVLSHVEPGWRMIVMDRAKATADEDKLQAPDVFEADAHGQLRNGLVDDHAWNLHKFVRAIRDERGYQDRLLLLIRLDGPDEGANVNLFNPDSVEQYRLAIDKLIRYLETTLPTVPFKLVLGNEPDRFEERPWSDPQSEPRTFMLDEFAPAMGALMKALAQQRPEVTFICPALSTNMKQDQLAYYTAFFGQERPENLVPALHAYGDDAVILPGTDQSFVEQQAEVLRGQGHFKHIACTEIGFSKPGRDLEALSRRGRFDDVVAWLLLSTAHQAPPGQNNDWNFRLDPNRDDPAARQLAAAINASQYTILRNIRERGGANLQIVRTLLIDRPNYAVEYVAHNTPTAMIAGQTQAVQLTVRNTSRQTWLAGGPHPVRLGYHWYTRAGADVPAASWDDHRTWLPADVLPGESVTLRANLAAPRVPDAYEVRWDMVEELRTWFAWRGAPTLNVAINVKPGDGLPEPDGLRLSASHNNVLTGVDNLLQAFDGRPETRWSTQTVQQPGMWVELDLNEIRPVSGLALDTTGSPNDYPRGYVVRLSTDRAQWEEVARNDRNDRTLDVAFTPRPARYIRIEQTGRSDRWWWSIHEIMVRFDSVPPRLSASASHNNVLTGANNLLQALDGRPETRWSTRAVQQPGMWFELDLNEIRPVSGLALDTTGSPRDHPRGYIVCLSTDGTQWETVARTDHNDSALEVRFSSRSARYIRIEQTGRSDRWWWSINEVSLSSDPFRPGLSATASHNNVQAGPDNVLQAFDGRPETRWSTQAVQQPGMWFELDLNEIRPVGGLTLDTTGSPNDYPRGYIIRLSTDRAQWTEVARQDRNDRALDVTFTAYPARYLRIEQTGRSDRWWWSIHQVTIKP